MRPEIIGADQTRPAASAAGRSLADELAGLPTASLTELKARFRQLHRRPAPESVSRDMLARLVAHRLQERQLGGLDRGLSDQLDRMGRGQPAARRLKPGTVLMREHDGHMHEVVTVPGGFLWNGETFKSLSIIAKKITGTSWNGPRFFGLRADRAADAGAARHA